MVISSKLKWFGTIILAGIILGLGLIGGNWGTDYSASASVYASPQIEYIIPEVVPFGSPDIQMIIHGLNFGPEADTQVWLTKRNNTFELTPITFSPTELTVTIPSSLLELPALYRVQVAIYVGASVPGDMLSNSVHFFVYSPETYYPLMLRDTLLRNP